MKKTIYIFLWIFGAFGMLGLHRFYLGYKITGFIWFFTLGGMMLGAIYDILNVDKLIAESEGNDYVEKKKSLAESEKKKENNTIASSNSSQYIQKIRPSCIYCGSASDAGGPCHASPSKYHVVDLGPNKCKYCGVSWNGGPCSRSPHGKHEKGVASI